MRLLKVMTAAALTLGITTGLGLVQAPAASAAAAKVQVTVRVRLSGPDLSRNAVLFVVNAPGHPSDYPCQIIPRDTWIDVALTAPLGANVFAYASGQCYDGTTNVFFTVDRAGQKIDVDLVA